MKPGTSAAQLKDFSDERLAEFMAGWKQGTPDWIMADQEWKRRHNHGNVIRGWIAIGISAVALMVAFAALFWKH